MRAWAWLLVGLAGVLPAAEARAQHLGRTVTDVRVEIAGQPVAEAGVLSLIETRIGDRLDMRAVRGTIDHLVGLGRFEDVQVHAEPSADGVALRWRLTPVRRVARITIGGTPVLSASALRTVLVDRFGTLPSVNRVPDMVTALRTFYADRGFPRAEILPRVEQDGAPERVELVLAIAAGDRLTVGSANVTGTPLEPAAAVLRALDLQPGQPFDQPALDARLAAYEESLRARGHYEARVRASHVPAEDGRTVSVTVAVTTGPRVRIVFAGDRLPGNPDTLVPIRQERSVDQDLLEDASLAIERVLREEGYREARAPYTRTQTGGELLLTFTIARGPLHRVASVETAGERTLDRATLAPLLQIEPGEPFVEARVAAVAAALAELYRVRGFAQAVVTTDIQVLPAAQDGPASYRPVAIRYAIREGPQTMVTAVELTGVAAMPIEDLRGRLALTPGRPFYRPQLAVDRNAIERAYRNRGYQTVAVNSQLDFADEQQAVTVTWTIREGPQLTVDRVLIHGNTRIATELIERELTFQRGSPVSDDAMIESQRRLAALGLFRRVRIAELPRTGSLTRDVLVEIEEADTTTIDYGGGLEVGSIGGRDEVDGSAIDKLDFGPRGFLAVSRRNLWGKNRSVTVFGRVTLRRREPGADTTDVTDTGGYGFHDYRGLFTFREPRVFGTGGDVQVTAFVEQGQRTSYTFNRKGVTGDYARRLGDFTVTGRYSFDYTKLLDERISVEDQLPIDRLFPQVRLSKLFAGVLRDSRDDVLDPQRGTVVGIDASVALRSLGSEVGFVKSFAQGFVYRRLPGYGVVLAAGARVGMAQGFARAVEPVLEIASPAAPALATMAPGPWLAQVSSPFATVVRDLPASERFFAGGDTTVRGFAMDRLGTVDTLDRQGFPQGGNGLAVFNLEARAPYWKNLQFVWFVDAGNVFARAADIRLDDLRMSSGIGFRYRSPIGPLRVDWGWKLGARLLQAGGRERSNVLHISLGQAF